MLLMNDPGLELQSLVPGLLALCEQTGRGMLEHYHNSQQRGLAYKKDDSPVTQADLDSHAQLQRGLHALSPDYPVLSEEAVSSHGDQRFGWTTYWLVDPLDGTREFIAGTGDFSINIALIDDHKPVLGVLYLPLSRRAYVGIPGQGAYRYHMDETSSPQVLSTRALRVDAFVACTSRAKHDAPRLTQFFDWCHDKGLCPHRVPSGGAIKFCQLSDGEADCYPRFSPCCEWDVAAGQAILEAAGGSVVDMRGQPLRYNLGDDLYSPHFLAIADPDASLWREYGAQQA